MLLIYAFFLDCSYRRNVKKLSFVYRNQSTRPRDNLIYWVNSTIRSSRRHQIKKSGFNVSYFTNVPLDLMTLTVVLFVVALTFKYFSLVSYKRIMTEKNK